MGERLTGRKGRDRGKDDEGEGRTEEGERRGVVRTVTASYQKCARK